MNITVSLLWLFWISRWCYWSYVDSCLISLNFLLFMSHSCGFPSIPASFLWISFYSCLIPVSFLLFLCHSCGFPSIPVPFLWISFYSCSVPVDFLLFLCHSCGFPSIAVSFLWISLYSCPIPVDFFLFLLYFFHSCLVPLDFSLFLWIPVLFLWTPLECTHSCRNLWGTEKYWVYRGSRLSTGVVRKGVCLCKYSRGNNIGITEGDAKQISDK